MHVGVLADGAQASGARSEPTRHRSDQFRIATHRGYAAAEWLGSTWRFQVRLQQPLGISPAPAPQPISVRALSRNLPYAFCSARLARSRKPDSIDNILLGNPECRVSLQSEFCV